MQVISHKGWHRETVLEQFSHGHRQQHYARWLYLPWRRTPYRAHQAQRCMSQSRSSIPVTSILAASFPTGRVSAGSVSMHAMAIGTPMLMSNPTVRPVSAAPCSRSLGIVVVRQSDHDNADHNVDRSRRADDSRPAACQLQWRRSTRSSANVSHSCQWFDDHWIRWKIARGDQSGTGFLYRQFRSDRYVSVIVIPALKPGRDRVGV